MYASYDDRTQFRTACQEFFWHLDNILHLCDYLIDMQNKKLYRSQTNRVLAGVCGGLGEYFGIDPLIFRILFIILPGMNLFVYLIIAIFIPNNPNQKAQTGGSIIKKILIFFLVIFFSYFLFNVFKLFFFGSSQ